MDFIQNLTPVTGMLGVETPVQGPTVEHIRGPTWSPCMASGMR